MARLWFCFRFFLVLIFGNGGKAFVPRQHCHKLSPLLTSVPSATSYNRPSRESDFYIPSDKVWFPIYNTGKGEADQKIININGLWCIFVSLIISPIWILAMTLLNFYYKINKNWDPNRAVYDKTGKIWSKLWLFLNGSYPTRSGNLAQLKGKGIGPCLYVANHSAWLDIPLICTVLNPVFKFISKGDLKGVPGIGQQLTGGKHILLDREDRKSQLKTFKDGIAYLKKGVPLMAFPEGTRSKTGRLMNFKGGVFAMALKTGVPVVPLTICNAHAVWPSYALLPIQAGRKKLHVHVHSPIDSKGKTEEELAALVRQAFMSALPESQQPLPDPKVPSETKDIETEGNDASKDGA